MDIYSNFRNLDILNNNINRLIKHLTLNIEFDNYILNKKKY